MKAFTAVVALLLVCSASVQGRKLLADEASAARTSCGSAAWSVPQRGEP